MKEDTKMQEVKDLEAKLEAARYVFHQVIRDKYVFSGHEFSEAQTRYNKAMENYDGIVANAVSGNSRDANSESMNRGFYITDKEREILAHRRRG